MNTKLTIKLAEEEYGQDLIIDLAVIRHLVMAGSTGSGKSVLLHNIVGTLLSNNSPEYLKLILIDPKRVEMTMYKHIPHLLTEVITDPKKAVLAMKWAVREINRRYDVLKEGGFMDVSEYKGKETMPEIVIVIDEFSDLMQTYPKETESVILKITQMGHVVGVHIILSSSRPSINIFTKTILDVIPARIGLQVGSAHDSKLIIGTDDAVKLRGAGDILFRNGLKYIVRGQAKFISEDDVKTLCKSVSEKYKDSTNQTMSTQEEYGDDEDDMYEPAKEAVISSGTASTSFIQRKLGIGYSRAAQLMDRLEERGVIGPANGSKPREVMGSEK